MDNLKENVELANLLYPNVKDASFYLNNSKPRNVEGEVTRIAPSPTGYLHIGQLYQAVVHRMLANKTNGLFFCRLEDTDNKREVEHAGEIAYDMLVKFGLKPDEGYSGKNGEIGEYGPYIQSKRLEIYHSFAHELVKRGRAFPCFCEMAKDKEDILKRREEELEASSDLEVKDPCRDLSLREIKEKLSEGKPFALRLRSEGDKDKTYKFIDAIKGEREVRENTKDDVLIKSNGIPVYSFAHIVDDLLMRTTTVIRGQEWFQSLPVHIELSKAFGFEPFKYAHTPNICVLDENGNKRKISKRKDPFADVRYFLKNGYPTVAIVEYLLNLLNSDFEDWRNANPYLPYSEFPFAMEKIGVTNPMFDFMKLNDVSKNVISRMKATDVYDGALDWSRENDPEFAIVLENNREIAIKALNIDREIERPRKDITTYADIKALYNYVFSDIFDKSQLLNFDEKYSKDVIKNYLTKYLVTYNPSHTKDEWFTNIKQVASECGFATDNKLYKQNPTAYAGNTAEACNIIRIAMTGRSQTPDLYEIMKVLGDEVSARIKYVIDKL